MADRFDPRDPSRSAWTRRDTLAALAASGTGLWLAQLAPGARAQGTSECIVRPSHIEGPYFVDENMERSDIRSDPGNGGALSPGTPLDVEFRVFAAAGPGCKPLSGVTVDVWHCDAQGIYSDVKDPSFDTLGKRFLRGHQITGAQGSARFQTIYPGAYEGRAVHIHFKLRYPVGAQRRGEFTSQVYFTDALNKQVHAQAPYSTTEAGARTMLNADDPFFQHDGGSQLMLTTQSKGTGYSATFELALQDIYPA